MNTCICDCPTCNDNVTSHCTMIKHTPCTLLARAHLPTAADGEGAAASPVRQEGQEDVVPDGADREVPRVARRRRQRRRLVRRQRHVSRPRRLPHSPCPCAGSHRRDVTRRDTCAPNFKMHTSLIVFSSCVDRIAVNRWVGCCRIVASAADWLCAC